MSIRRPCLVIPALALVSVITIACPGKQIPTPTTITGAWFPAAGGGHTCVATSDGMLKCWGDDTFGQIGDGSMSPTPVLSPSGVPPWATNFIPTALVGVAAGNNHTCAIGSANKLWCWGQNDRGQMGVGSTTDQATPQPVRPVLDANNQPRLAEAVTAGRNHTCALYYPDVVACWGMFSAVFNPNGGMPSVIPGLSARAIATRDTQTCAIDTSNKVQCWEMSTTFPPAVVAVQGVAANAGSVLAVGRAHACVSGQGASVMCWGSNGSGQLTGVLGSGVVSPATVDLSAFGGAVIALAAGDSHTCAIVGVNAFSGDGAVVCWGWNNLGQTGDSSSDPSKPFKVIPSGARKLALGFVHSCATVLSGSVTRMQCWGRNDAGQLGDGTRNDSTAPVGVIGVP